jgi:hypothetical protein
LLPSQLTLAVTTRCCWCQTPSSPHHRLALVNHRRCRTQSNASTTIKMPPPPPPLNIVFIVYYHHRRHRQCSMSRASLEASGRFQQASISTVSPWWPPWSSILA